MPREFFCVRALWVQPVDAKVKFSLCLLLGFELRSLVEMIETDETGLRFWAQEPDGMVFTRADFERFITEALGKCIGRLAT